MNTESPAIFNSTDLVLQLAGGDRNGQLLPVNTAKCLLSSLIADKAEAEKYRCAIFRGEKGVAFRSYSEHVLVNGAKTSVQWLREGDTIQLTPEMKVVVKQLGTFTPTKAANTSNAPAPAVRQDANTIAMPVTTGDAASKTPVNTTPANTPNSVAEQTQVAPVGEQNVGQRVEVLSDKLSSLVDEASGTTAAAAAATAAVSLTNQSASETPVGEPLSEKKMADASSSIQDYLDKALAPTGADSVASPTPTLEMSVAAAAEPVTGTQEARNVESTVEFPATSEVSPASSTADSAAKLREEEVTSSLNRLLSRTDKNLTSQDPVVPTSEITADDQSPADSALVPNPTQLLTTPAEVTPVATETVEATTPVDAPKTQTLDFLKSLGIDAEELGLGNGTPTSENTTAASTQPVADAPQVDAPSAALPTADEIIASASMGSAVAANSDSIGATEVLAEEETPEPVAAPQKAESVADVLARMQNAGSLDSFSMDGPAEETASVANVAAEVAPPKPQVTETVVGDASTESESGGGEDSSVEDYMSQLLNRMRGGDDAEKAEDKELEEEKPAAKEEVKTEIVETVDAQPTREPLTAEQFVPKQKAVRMESFDSLREIANSSNRLAIQDHLANQRKVSTTTKLQLALISLGFGIVFFLMSCVFSSQLSFGGIFCGLAFLICGLGFGKLYLDEKKLDASIVQEQKAKS